MRNFEVKYENEYSEISNIYQIVPSTPQADRQNMWSEMTKKYEISSNEKRTNFYNNFLSASRSLHYELLKRLGLEYPSSVPGHGLNNAEQRLAINVLETGSLNGTHPVASLANYLQDLANKLP